MTGLPEDSHWFGFWLETTEVIRQCFPDSFASYERFGGRKTTKDVLLGNARIGTLIQLPPNRWRDRAFDFKTTLEILGELVGETKGAAGDGDNRSISPVELADELGMSTATLRTCAKAAKVPRPGRGERNFRYPNGDATKIAIHVRDKSSTKKHREAARRWVEDQKETGK